ncbi:MAG: hypothetical protein JOY71_03740 [Acetobacteraceae bacterium]|nr:hypothetical protein [Acetobacteraceae bacterium]MBV8521235.1 hypothetical protein [Acetobacteraceae bacterium]
MGIAVIGRDYRYLRVNPIYERCAEFPRSASSGCTSRIFGGSTFSNRESSGDWTDALRQKYKATPNGAPALTVRVT